MTELRRMALAARVFTLAAITSTALVGDVDLNGVTAVVAIAIISEIVSLSRALPERYLVIAEGICTALAAASAFPVNEAALPYLATPALIAGIAGGTSWVVLVLIGEAGAIGFASWALDGHFDFGASSGYVTWLTTGLGLGLLGTVTRRNLARSDADSSYRSALDLIKQLDALSGRLTSGLDPVDLATQALTSVSEELVVRRAAVVTRNAAGRFMPLRYSAGAVPFSVEDSETLLYRCWQTKRTVVGGSRIALPMVTENERVAVVLVECVGQPERRALERAVERLDGEAIRLHAALLFTSVRESATSEERQRLAREVHDGVAQDVASLGYLVDNLASVTTDPEQAQEVAKLRKEVTRVVAELRNSVFDLRNETAAGQGLGQSIASFARHIGSHSPLRVHVSLDESSLRLRPRVETELLRITQEAINNARRNSGGSNLWVTCLVHPPRAEIEVIDDGEGLGSARDDSHGLAIMRERAEHIGASISIESPAPGGTGTRVAIFLD